MPAAPAQPSQRASSPSRCQGRRRHLSLTVRKLLQRAMQVRQHARGCGATSWRPQCFHNLCRVGSQVAFGSHTSSLTGPRALRTHRASYRHAQKSKAAGAKHRTVTCQAQEPVAHRMSIKVGDTQVHKLSLVLISLKLTAYLTESHAHCMACR